MGWLRNDLHESGEISEELPEAFFREEPEYDGTIYQLNIAEDQSVAKKRVHLEAALEHANLVVERLRKLGV